MKTGSFRLSELLLYYRLLGSNSESDEPHPDNPLTRSRAKGLSTSLVDAYTLRMAEKPELTIIRDMDDYPATARCSTCGREMALRQRWFTSAAENLAWFGDRFRLHLEQEHSS